MYNAFISYSHAMDGKLAPALQSAVRRFASPWYRRSPLRIFRDETNLSVSPGLWSSIETALSESQHLILLASPAAAASKWVRRELDYWLLHRTPQTLLIVLTEGTLEWNDAGGDFHWQRTNALPDSLAKVFVEEPLYLDLRSISRAQDLAQDNPAFRDTIAALTSVLLGRPKDELIGEDIAIRRRARRMAWAVGCALLTLTILLGLSTWFALSQRDSLARSLRVVRGQKLAAEAQLVRTGSANQLQTSVLLSLEAIRLAPSTEAEAMLRQTVALLLPPVRRLQPPSAHDATAVVAAMAFSADGRSIATVGDGPAPRWWDIATGREIRTFTASDRVAGSGRALAFTPDGSQLISSSLQGVTFWNTADGQVAMYQKTEWPITTMAISANGRFLATGDHEGEVRVVERASGREVLRGRHDIIVNSVAFTADATLLASGSNDKTVRIWSLAKGREVLRLPHEIGVISVAFSPDAQLVATAGWEGLARIWEVSSGRQLAAFDQRTTIRSVAFSTDGKRLATAGDDGTVRIWDRVSGLEVARGTHDAGVVAVTFSPDGRYIATASQNAVVLWKTTYGNEVAQLAHPDDIVVAVVFSPDGQRLVTAAGPMVRIWDLGTGRELYRLKHDSGVDDVVFTADGAFIETVTKPQPAGANQTCVHVWDAGSGKQLRRFCQDFSATAFSPDGSHIVLAERHSGISIRNLATGISITQVKGIIGADFQSKLALSAQGHYIAAAVDAQEGDALYIAQIVGDAPSKKISLNSEPNQLVFSSDERQLAAATDKGVMTWEVSSGREIARISLSAGSNTIAYAADGQHLATGSRDQSVRVWAIPQMREVAHFEVGGNISRVAFSPNMELVAAASSDRTARIWRWKADPVKEACARLTRNLTRVEWQSYLGDEPYRATCPGLPGL